VKINKAMFFSLFTSEKGEMIFSESDRIPLKDGISYGWGIHLSTEKDNVTWKEVFILPEIPSVWGHCDDTKITNQGRVAITEKTVSSKGGWIGNMWSVAEGDPPGSYVMLVYVEGVLSRIFSFFAE
jgi:hypothetical protein